VGKIIKFEIKNFKAFKANTTKNIFILLGIRLKVPTFNSKKGKVGNHSPLWYKVSVDCISPLVNLLCVIIVTCHILC